MTPLPPRQLGLTIPAKVYAGLTNMAKAAGMTPTGYGNLLFIAAYSAKCKPTGDRDLDTSIARVALLFGEGSLNSAEIAARVGLSEATVVRTIEAWRAELSGRRVA